MKKLNSLVTLFSLLISAHALSMVRDEISETQKNVHYRNQCLENKEYLVKRQYTVNCNYNYHHYNAASYKSNYRASKAKENGNVRISGFNLWHPGTTKTLFKDFELVAKTINQWDVVGALELLPVVSTDLKNNKAVVTFIKDGDRLVENLQQRIAIYKNRKMTATNVANIEKYTAKLNKLKLDLAEAPSLYRAPGYLKILTELRKLDKTWALVLAPRGEAFKETDVQELSGFFYRSSTVRPVTNEYCRDVKTNGFGTPFACIPSFTSYFMGAEYRHVFSRRPLMASFKSGNFDFTILASHVVFNSPKDEEIKRGILQSVFGTDTLEYLGQGITKATYARFAETATMLRFMNILRANYEEKDIILVGDFNLEKNNPFWQQIIREFPGGEVLIDEPTSLTTQRISGGSETGGYASNYDHFVLDPSQTTECDISSAKRESITTGRIGYSVKRRYNVRSNEADIDGNYPITAAGERRVQRHLNSFYNKESQLRTISRNQVVSDTRDLETKMKNFERRMFTEQQHNRTYYRMYMEAISDHAPISMNCSTN